MISEYFRQAKKYSNIIHGSDLWCNIFLKNISIVSNRIKQKLVRWFRFQYNKIDEICSYEIKIKVRKQK